MPRFYNYWNKYEKVDIDWINFINFIVREFRINRIVEKKSSYLFKYMLVYLARSWLILQIVNK